MNKVNINIAVHTAGRPIGTSKKATKLRNGWIIKAYWKGASIGTIAKAFNISKTMVYKIIATSRA